MTESQIPPSRPPKVKRNGTNADFSWLALNKSLNSPYLDLETSHFKPETARNH